MLRTITFISILFSSLVRADHFSGSSITYECLGGGQYRIFLELYLDCAGSEMIPQDLYFSNSCGTSFTLIGLEPVYTQELSPVCEEELPNSSCNGGTLPGFRYHRFEVVTFLPSCNYWNIQWRICCRNSMVNIQGVPGLYVNATLNNSGGFCDDSPRFTNPTGVPFVCVNNTMYYNPAVVDPDGHTLSYSLITARYSGSGSVPVPVPVNYSNGLSGALPIPGITLDPLTGQIIFTPTVAGNYTVVLQVTSHKADGTLIGTVMNDLMFIVPACNGEAPAFEGLIDAENSIIVGTNELAVCEGIDFCVDMVFSDDDPSAEIAITSNAATLLPGSTLSFSGTNPVYATLCWTVTPAEFPFNLFVQASDGACPISNISSHFIFANECIPLPVELIAFHASQEEDMVLLEWSTGSETGFGHYLLERAGSDGSFSPIAQVEGKGSAYVASHYTYTDPEPTAGINYYRLRLVDLDGTEELGPVEVILFSGRSDLRMEPDGMGGWRVHGAGNSATWQLVDVAGRILATGTSNSSGTIHTRIAGPQKGIELLVVYTDRGREVIKLPITTLSPEQ